MRGARWCPPPLPAPPPARHPRPRSAGGTAGRQEGCKEQAAGRWHLKMVLPMNAHGSRKMGTGAGRTEAGGAAGEMHAHSQGVLHESTVGFSQLFATVKGPTCVSISSATSSTRGRLATYLRAHGSPGSTWQLGTLRSRTLVMPACLHYPGFTTQGQATALRHERASVNPWAKGAAAQHSTNPSQVPSCRARVPALAACPPAAVADKLSQQQEGQLYAVEARRKQRLQHRLLGGRTLPHLPGGAAGGLQPSGKQRQADGSLPLGKHGCLRRTAAARGAQSNDCANDCMSTLTWRSSGRCTYSSYRSRTRARPVGSLPPMAPAPGASQFACR